MPTQETLTPGSIGGLPTKKIGERSPYFNILIYGESGVGKTVLAGSASAVPEMCPVLYIDMEGGTESLRNTYPDVEIVRVKTPQELDDVFHALKNTKHPYKAVIIDSETEIQQFFMDNIMRIAADNNPNQDEDVASVREHGKNLVAMRKHVRGFRDLPMHTIFLALSKDDKDPKTNKTKTMPNLTGKFAKELASLIDVVCYYYLKQLKDEPAPRRFLLTTATESIIAKDRSGLLPQVMDSVTMQDIFNLMTEKIDKNLLESSIDKARGNISTDESFAALTS